MMSGAEIEDTGSSKDDVIENDFQRSPLTAVFHCSRISRLSLENFINMVLWSLVKSFCEE